MERPSHGNPVEVSAHWTPQHLDVTDAPLRYAPPKADWTEEFDRLRPFVRSDAADRMARRRAQTRAIVDPAEITVLPPLVRAAASAQPDRTPPAWLGGMRSITSRLRARARVA
ncbi:MAG: hypothetical protein JO083_01195 [Candidatus Eremiobacteraeota bacterium]|nr:hypothetical protein [Candidatus Eremiobacteraeota bacterium]